MSDQRLTELEIKLAYQEDTIKVLNEVVYQQQLRIDKLAALVQDYCDQIDRLADTVSVAPGADEKPPHY